MIRHALLYLARPTNIPSWLLEASLSPPRFGLGTCAVASHPNTLKCSAEGLIPNIFSYLDTFSPDDGMTLVVVQFWHTKPELDRFYQL
jgi:hypothetical protein